ncbi:MAG TPA: phosphoribosyltransferase family protein [Acidimicrobiia bacterium]|jgi:predicted phosphoribosyltransferase|nr:phosphoribosyltransferase family protein [Acidimicrobiia bacterium]
MRFDDRRAAGRMLGEVVRELDPHDPVVYALPRGGVPVGFEVSRVLECPLDVLVVRKIGVPYQPELAMGALGEGGTLVRNSEVLTEAGIDEEDFAAVVERERRELDRRVASYRSAAPAVPAEGKTAVIVDDGLATGSTALAAVSVLERKGAGDIWVAVPVAPQGPLGGLERRADRVVTMHRPARFGAVGSWYRDFGQTDDDEVRDLLARSRLA